MTRPPPKRPLAVIGNVNVDLILGPTAPWPQPGTEVIVEHDELRVGGAAGNASLAWAGLGVPHQIAASTGNDAFGTWLRAGFGPSADRWTVEATSTTVSVGITHPGDERTFFTTQGHLPAFSWESVEAMLDAEALRGGILLVCGSFLTGRLVSDYAKLFDWAATHGVDVALDTGWPLAGWTEAVRAEVLCWLPRCRYLLLNEIEAAALAGVEGHEAAADVLAPRLAEAGLVVTKLGPRGASARLADGTRLDCPAPSVAVIDTIGAGDVFNAGFLLAIAEEKPVAAALVAGTALASRAISTHPRRYGDF